MKTLKDIGEISAIDRLRRLLRAGPDIIRGPGDDCAVVRPARSATQSAAGGADDPNFDWLLTSDPVIEGIHFAPETTPQAIGHKAIGRALSDIAAMGGEPEWALVNVVARPDMHMSRLEKIYSGACKLADRYDLAIAGGDLSRGQNLELHVFAVGRVPSGSAILRSGAKPGDAIYVTGSLGASMSKGSCGKEKHLSFEPRVTEGIWLRTESWPTSLIDISDGLARDLWHIADMSRVGAVLDCGKIPVSNTALEINDGTPPLKHALYDGEDFELLFTIPPDKQKAFESSWNDIFDLKCSYIGRITDKTKIMELINEKGKRTVLNNKGYDHFKSK